MSKKPPTCATCKFFRNGSYCSNSKSQNYRWRIPENEKFVTAEDGCGEHTPADEKAPAAMRAAIQVMDGLRKAIKGS